ncbi:MAG: TraR/DksA family transcriptional regulator [Planctomycetia bacterium]|nr:TraR/DksA family transcriptional regulator [Planctomycetia bacterium]
MARVRPDVEAVIGQVMGGSGGQAGGQLSNAPLHMGDSGTDEFLHEMNATLLENEQFLSEESNLALLRIDDGTFGHCEECAVEIGQERLEAIPYVRLCISCASASPDMSPNLNVGRPRSSTDTMASPAGRSKRKSKSQRIAAANADVAEATADAEADTFAAENGIGGLADAPARKRAK